MIGVKDAIRCALQFLGEVLERDSVRDTRLEEVVLSEDETTWYITFSFFRGDSPSDLALAIDRGPRREYKIIEVSAEDGAVRSMKIRQLETA